MTVDNVNGGLVVVVMPVHVTMVTSSQMKPVVNDASEDTIQTSSPTASGTRSVTNRQFFSVQSLCNGLSGTNYSSTNWMELQYGRCCRS